MLNPVRLAAPCLALIVALSPASAFADTFAVQGSLRTAGGGPVADGEYGLAVRFYDSDQKLVFEEKFIGAKVAGGLFVLVLGESGNPALDAAALAAKSAFVGVQVGSEPQLPLVPLRPVLRAWRTEVAALAEFATEAAHAALADSAKSANSAQVAAFADSAKQADFATSANTAALATDALHAATADVAKLAAEATHALQADHAVFADAAKQADNAATAEEAASAAKATVASAALALQCTGCIVADHLDAAVLAPFAKTASVNAFTQGQSIAGTLDMKNNEIQAFRVHNAAKAPFVCDAAHSGAIYFDTAEKAFVGCNGDAWASLGAAAANSYGQAPGNPGKSCLDIKTKVPAAASAVYWLKPASGAAFAAWCDMETDGGGWTMCSSDNHSVRISTELSSKTAFGQDGYRSDCTEVAFKEVIYVRHDNGQKAWFARDNGQTTTAKAVGFGASGDKLGTWSAKGGVASGAWKYQLVVCDVSMWTGFFLSGYTNCWKSCGSWCSDTTTHYYRYDGTAGNSYDGVAFHENGHTNVADKLVSVGLR